MIADPRAGLTRTGPSSLLDNYSGRVQNGFSDFANNNLFSLINPELVVMQATQPVRPVEGRCYSEET